MIQTHIGMQKQRQKFKILADEKVFSQTFVYINHIGAFSI